MLGWCPPERRAEYRHLTRDKRIKAADARRIILDTIAAERARAENLSPFERQERALRKGAKIIANDRLFR